MKKTTRPAALFFDVNETLLNLAGIKQSVAAALGNNPSLATLWFHSLLHHSLVTTSADRFRTFGEIGVATLIMTAESNGIDLSETRAKDAMQPLLSAPPHPDVIPALTRLKQAHFRMGALTNSSRGAMEQQLKTAGVDRFFNFMLSVEDKRIYKPHREVYQWAAETQNLPLGNCMMIAAHGWDVGGAAWAGMRTAFVARPGQAVFPLAPLPELTGKDMEAIAQQLIELPE